MDDEETVALIAGGHTFGKTHGAVKEENVGPDPAGAPTEQQGLGLEEQGRFGLPLHERARRRVVREPGALDVPVLRQPVRVRVGALEEPRREAPVGAGGRAGGRGLVPDAQDRSKRHTPVMLTTDLSLRFDPEYSKISKRFHENPEEFKVAFAKAWFKLTHRDMGPRCRYVGSEVPDEALIWQDPVPAVDHELIDAADAAALKAEVLASGLGVSELVRTAWAAASSFRNTDLRGGANGARVRLAPQKDWEVNGPAELAKVLGVLEAIQKQFQRLRRPAGSGSRWRT